MAPPNLMLRRRGVPQSAQIPITVTISALWMMAAAAPSAVLIGPVSLSAIFTGLLVALILSWLPAYVLNPSTPAQFRGPVKQAGTRVPLTMWGFVLIATFGSVVIPSADYEFNVNSAQNVLVYWLFVGCIASASAAKSRSAVLAGWELMRTAATWAAYIFFAIAALRLQTALGVRTLAMGGIVVLALVVPGTPRNVWMKFAPFVVVAAMVLSLSRTATIIGCILLVFIVVREGKRSRVSYSSRRFKALSVLLVSVMSLGLLVFYYEPFRNRFLVGDNAFQVGDLSLSTMGRNKMWDLMLSDPDMWMLGHGSGAAAQLIYEHLGLVHPHNDYLRFYFDFGIIGLILFLVGYLTLATGIFRNARRTDHPLHWAAFIAMTGVGLLSVTDNCFVYGYVMAPLGSVIGLSLALSRFDHAEVRSDHSRLAY